MREKSGLSTIIGGSYLTTAFSEACSTKIIIADKTDTKMIYRWIKKRVYEERNRRTHHSSTGPGVTNTMEESTYRETRRNINMQNAQ